MNDTLAPLDQRLIDLLKVNARLPVVKLAQALGCARSTVQLRLKALEDAGVITGYTVTLVTPQASARIRAMVLIATESESTLHVVKTLTRRHEINKIFSVSGRYDLSVMLTTESTEELDSVIDRIRGIKGVKDTFSTILLSSKLDRPE
ncbi:MAG: Lrp/AsnC family transcriptional regulator [Burkholderiales bacterium]|nr:Lrp/AsnC family transcriptional regulator [Burkholderiales bacterium]